MDRDRFDAVLGRLLPPDAVRRAAPLAPLTTFRVGGPADWLIEIRSVDELQSVLQAAADCQVPVSILGGGSNVVVSDAGVPGAVLRLLLTLVSQASPEIVRAEAGVTINGLVRWTIGRGLAGLEDWAGTPGTVGGAIFGNAHFAGRNIGDLVTQVLLVTRAGLIVPARQDEMAFAYDRSRLQHSGEILVWADFRVGTGDTESLRRRARASLAYRKRTQPLAMPSAGCIFQNPDPAVDRVPPDIPWSAGALVDRAGFKARRVGGATISPAHANFIVSDGTATAADIRRLIEQARRAVRDQFGVELRDEVVYLGEFADG